MGGPEARAGSAARGRVGSSERRGLFDRAGEQDVVLLVDVLVSVSLEFGEGIEHGAVGVARIGAGGEAIGQLAHPVERGAGIVVIGEHVVDRLIDAVRKRAGRIGFEGSDRGEEKSVLLLGVDLHVGAEGVIHALELDEARVLLVMTLGDARGES